MSLPTHFPIRAAGGKTIEIPSVGFGTWAAGGTGWCKNATLAALKAGYRHLDCAWMYGVNQEIGAAIRESGIPREEIFITSKFWPHFAAPENVEICLDIDVLLKAKSGPGSTPASRGQLWDEEKNRPVIDWEHTSTNIASRCGRQGSFVPTWQAMQELVKKGKTRTIGLSNFSIAELKDIIPHENDIPISCNQIEAHPWLPNNELVAFAKEHSILTTCFSPFAGQKADGATLLKDEPVLKLAKKNNMDVGQLLQSWAVQRGTVPLGKSSTPARIKSNLSIRKLSPEDMKALDSLDIPNGKGRTVDFTTSWEIPLFQN